MSKKSTLLVISLACVALLGAGIAYNWGFQAHKYRTQFIRKHTANRITIQVDSVATGLFGTGYGIGVGGTPSDTGWAIAGTAKDTSVAFMSWPYMAHRFAFTDTTGNDSVAYQVKLYMGSRPDSFDDQKLPPPYGSSHSANYWALVDSVTITGSAAVYKTWTASPIPTAPWCYMTIQGTADNVTLGSALGTVVADHWDELPAK